MFGDITVKCRPLRLAFLITPDKAALRKAIQINSTLWGGTFNPIIPLYAQPPKVWKDYPRQKLAMKDRVAGYVRAFDPDFLVDCTGAKLPPYVGNLGRPMIPVDEIWSKFYAESRDGAPQYGVGIFELLEGIYKEYFEVVRRFPSKIVFPVFPKEHALFWAAAVGELPEPIQTAVEEGYSEALDIEKPTIGPQDYEALLRSSALFPRNITRYELKVEGFGFRHESSRAFYMDATKFGDIVDFWNLRALGGSVIPIPKQFVGVPEYVTFIRNFIRDRYRVNLHNAAITHGTTVIRSFSTTMAELQALANALDPTTIIPDQPEARALSLQHWYPRIWDEWAMGMDNATPDNISSSTTDYSFPEVPETVSFDFVKPKFVGETSGDTPQYANEIYPKFYGQGKDILADVLPYDHGEEVLRVAAGIFTSFRDEIRIGKTGAVHLVRWKRKTHWRLPLAEDVFFAWLKDKGFDAELSPCGRLAKQMNSQLGGWLSVLTNEPLLELFESMTRGGEDGKGAPLGEVKNRIKTTVGHGGLYPSLVERNVFQLGYKTQCKHCGRSSWFSVNALAAELTCPLCYKKLDAIDAVDGANKGAWHLKTAGPFSVEKFADGSYSVLLALNFLQQDRSLQTTPVMSFRAKHATTAKELEADLGAMWQETVRGETDEGVLFVECKSYNKFERKDFERMKALAAEFPGAILAFCTLRKTLTPHEVREIRKIARTGMKRWKTERPINPVLVLTGHELFSTFGAPQCWKGMSAPGWTERTHTLLGTCNATQAIHLGLPSWQDTWSAEAEKKRQRKRTKKVTA